MLPRIRSVTAAITCYALLIFFAAGCATVQGAFFGNSPEFVRLVRNYGPAVVHISVTRDPSQARSYAEQRAWRLEEDSLGSGFIISEDGFILTNAHVVTYGSQISVKLTDRREFKARLIGADPIADVALLKIDARDLPTVRIGDPNKVEVGEWALAIGAPYGFRNSVTAGVVSAKRRILPAAEYIPFIQTDVPVNPGNSGGPLFNSNGEVIGINSRIYSNSGGYQGLSFAIPIDVAMHIKEQLQTKGVVSRSRVGISVQEVSQALAHSFQLAKPQGALVGYVEKGAAADRAGIRSGDVITKVGRREVFQSADALIYIADLTPGEQANLTVWREGAQIVVPVVPDRFDLSSVPRQSARGNSRSPLGLVVRRLLPQESQVLKVNGGLLVQKVSPAVLRAGVMVGDVILAVNGKPVDSIQALADEAGTGEQVIALLIQRGSTRHFVPIEIQNGSDSEL